MIGQKLPKFWKKVAKTVAKPKNAKYIHQTTFETLKYLQQIIL
jgi:hypothetical protein